MVAKKMLIKISIKTLSNIYNVTEIKTSQKAVVCASKVIMAKSDKENMGKEEDGI
jgi:hypothetical protein